MAHLFQDKRKKPYVWRFQYTDHTGKRCTGTGTSSEPETRKLMELAQAKERAIRKGWAEAPKSSDTPRAFPEIMAQYLAWGCAQGGIGGRPWSKAHSKRRERLLGFWRARLGLQLVGDLVGILPRVEQTLREMKKRPKKEPTGRKEPKRLGVSFSTYAGKTLQNHVEPLVSFCRWCEKRGYLENNPLKGLASFDITPRVRRRALTLEEIQEFLAAVDETRLGFEIALTSGLRANEIRNLRVKHLDVEACGLHLDAAWTKNRQGGFQPLSRALVDRLAEEIKDKAPEEPLAFVPRNSARALYAALHRAGIPILTAAGKVDFHALRVAYTTFVVEAGTDLKTAQTLVRHGDPRLTLNLYAKAREKKLAEVAEAVGNTILTPKPPEKSTLIAHRQAVGAEHYPGSADSAKSSLILKKCGEGELNPHTLSGIRT